MACRNRQQNQFPFLDRPGKVFLDKDPGPLFDASLLYIVAGVDRPHRPLRTDGIGFILVPPSRLDTPPFGNGLR